MLKKWILISALFTNFCSTPVLAQEPGECYIPKGYSHGTMLLSCTLTSSVVKELGEYLQANPTTEELVLVYVDYDKQVGMELAQMLAENQTVKDLYFYDAHLRSQELATIANNNTIKRLALHNNEIDDLGIAILAMNHSITDLYLGEPSVSMPAVFQFLDHHHLQSFGLAMMDTSDDDLSDLVHHHAYFNSLVLSELPVSNLQPLQYLENLTGLAIYDMNVSNEDAKAIGQLVQLKYLELINTTITASGANQFANLKHLKMIYLMGNLTNSGIGDEGLQFIKQLPELWSAYLFNQNITDRGAALISENTHLTDIELGNNKIGNEGAIALSKNPNLHTIDLSSNVVGNEGARALANDSSLNNLYLARNKVGDAGAVALTNRANIHVLNLNENLLTDTTAYAFANQTTDLDYLFIMGNGFSKNAYEAMQNNQHIKYLSAGYMDDIGIQRKLPEALQHIRLQFMHKKKL